MLLEVHALSKGNHHSKPYHTEKLINDINQIGIMSKDKVFMRLKDSNWYKVDAKYGLPAGRLGLELFSEDIQREIPQEVRDVCEVMDRMIPYTSETLVEMLRLSKNDEYNMVAFSSVVRVLDTLRTFAGAQPLLVAARLAHVLMSNELLPVHPALWSEAGNPDVEGTLEILREVLLGAAYDGVKLEEVAAEVFIRPLEEDE